MDEVPLLEVRNLNKVYENGYHAVEDKSIDEVAKRLKKVYEDALSAK